jgi:hypothetical protein
MEPIFQAIHHTALGEWMRSEIWRVPAFEFVHLMGIVLLFGSLFVVNLRLFGVVLRTQPVAQVAGDVAKLQKLGLLLMILSGPVMFVTSAVKMYNTPTFWWKMGFLALALAYQFTLHARFTQRPDADLPRTTAMATAAVSFALWFSVLLNGMWTLLS